jgi:hypothetical protein
MNSAAWDAARTQGFAFEPERMTDGNGACPSGSGTPDGLTAVLEAFDKSRIRGILLLL